MNKRFRALLLLTILLFTLIPVNVNASGNTYRKVYELEKQIGITKYHIDITAKVQEDHMFPNNTRIIDIVDVEVYQTGFTAGVTIELASYNYEIVSSGCYAYIDLNLIKGYYLIYPVGGNLIQEKVAAKCVINQ